MSNESPSVEKSEQELFEEVSLALAEGKDIDSIMRNVEVTSTGHEAPPVEEPEVKDNVPPGDPAAVDPAKEADGTESTESEEEEPASPAVPPEVQERIAKLEKDRTDFEHRLKSDLGRIAALQRKVDELSRAQAAPPAATKAEPAATTPSVAKSKFDEKIAQIKELDPELADVLLALKDEVSEPLRKELTDKVSQTENLLRQREEQELWTKEKSRLLEMVPQADDVFKNPLWKQWKEVQPAKIRELASSADADEMFLAIQKFAADTAKAYPELAAQPPATPAASPAVAKVVEDRQRKLTSSSPAGSGASPKQGKGIPDESDQEALFNYVVSKLEKGEPIKF